MENLFTEEIPKELELSQEEIIKNRCDLITEQMKVLTANMDRVIEENEKYKVENQKLKNILKDIYERLDTGSSCSDDECGCNECVPSNSEEVPKVEEASKVIEELEIKNN
jgi:regulator of replication initiation timing